MVYLDTSVALAHIGTEAERPPPELWKESLISSRLLAYEIWSRLYAYGRGVSHGEVARKLLQRVATLELVEPVIGRATEGFPVAVRTLDALHLASMLFLVDQGVEIGLASYDGRMRSAAEALGIGLYPL
jgi:predicted nucleic acid-binding protein